MRLKITKRRVFWTFACIALIGSLKVGYTNLQAMRRKTAAERFRTASIHRGDIKFEVKCTGTVQPVLSVQVGSYVSGPIKRIYVDFNDKVKKDQILAEIDPQVYKAQCRQAKAALAHSLADLEQYKARYTQADQDFKRAKKLHTISDIPGINHPIKGIADSDYDLAKANYEMAKATVEQNRALLDMSETNEEYTLIRSPVDGTIIDRKVDAGQTLASQFQTPVMFVVAPDLEKKVYVLASIDEADIGLVRKAEKDRQPVHFTVDAYPDERFEGKIAQVRLGPKATLPGQVVNVVTYIAVVESPNAELKLLPGMTANLVFQIEKHDNVLKIPNRALRFHPRPEHIHPKYLALLEGLKAEDEFSEAAADAKKKEAEEKDEAEDDAKEKTEGKTAAKEKAEEKGDAKQKSDDKSDATVNADDKGNAKEKSDDKADAKDDAKNGNKKYVWILDGDLLSPVEVKVGINDARYTELISGALKEGQKIVVGIKTAAEAAASKLSK
jgi:HlyD family secretion protein